MDRTLFNLGNIHEILETPNWAIVTASNPKDVVLPDVENDVLNAVLNAALETFLKVYNFEYDVVYGRYGTDEKEVKSFLVYDINEASAFHIAKRFQQRSVLVPRGLLFTDGYVAEATGIRLFHSLESARKGFDGNNGYTWIPHNGVVFSVDLYWS